MGVGDGYAVGTGYGVLVGMAAIVAATACLIWALGLGVGFGVQALPMIRTNIVVTQRSKMFCFINVIILVLQCALIIKVVGVPNIEATCHSERAQRPKNPAAHLHCTQRSAVHVLRQIPFVSLRVTKTMFWNFDTPKVVIAELTKIKNLPLDKRNLI